VPENACSSPVAGAVLPVPEPGAGTEVGGEVPVPGAVARGADVVAVASSSSSPHAPSATVNSAAAREGTMRFMSHAFPFRA
jgi:hypothetical protein